MKKEILEFKFKNVKENEKEERFFVRNVAKSANGRLLDRASILGLGFCDEITFD